MATQAFTVSAVSWRDTELALRMDESMCSSFMVSKIQSKVEKGGLAVAAACCALT
ncbi:hypothetical protein D3C72_1910620 [compost metagenome]